MMNKLFHHILKAALLSALAFAFVGPVAASTTATAEQYHQAYCIYMRYATANVKAGDMDNAKQALRGAAEAERAYLGLDGTSALDASQCPGVDLSATYEPQPQPFPEIDEEIKLAKQRIAAAKRKDAEIKRQKERQAEAARRAEREAEAQRRRERERAREQQRSASANSGLNTFLSALGTAAEIYGAYKSQEYAIEQQQESIRAARVQQQLAYQRQQQQRYRDAQRIQTEQARRAEQERRAQQSWVERKAEDLLTTRTETFQLSGRTKWFWYPQKTYSLADMTCRNILNMSHERSGRSNSDGSGVQRGDIEKRNRHLKGFRCDLATVTGCSVKGPRKKHRVGNMWKVTATGYTICKWKG